YDSMEECRSGGLIGTLVRAAHGDWRGWHRNGRADRDWLGHRLFHGLDAAVHDCRGHSRPYFWRTALDCAQQTSTSRMTVQTALAWYIVAGVIGGVVSTGVDGHRGLSATAVAWILCLA